MEKKGLQYDAELYRKFLECIISENIYSENKLEDVLEDNQITKLVDGTYSYQRKKFRENIETFFINYHQEILEDLRGK